MSFLTRHEIGPAIAIPAAEAAKARRVLDDLERMLLTVRGFRKTGHEDRILLDCAHGIGVLVHDLGVGGISIQVLDESDVRARALSLHVHGRPAHFPAKHADPLAVVDLAVGVARQCVRVAASTKALRRASTGSIGAAAERHARRLSADAVARGHVPTGDVGEEVRVHHPWGDAPGLETVMLDGGAVHEATTARLERLLEVAVVGDASDRDLHVRGHVRSATPAAVADDPVEALRLLRELEDVRREAAAAAAAEGDDPDDEA